MDSRDYFTEPTYIAKYRERDPGDTIIAIDAYRSSPFTYEVRTLTVALLGKALEAIRNVHFGKKESDNDGGVGTALEALTWIYSDEEYPGSFISVCDILGIEPSYIRRKLLEISLGRDNFCPIRKYDYRTPETHK